MPNIKSFIFFIGLKKLNPRNEMKQRLKRSDHTNKTKTTHNSI